MVMSMSYLFRYLFGISLRTRINAKIQLDGHTSVSGTMKLQLVEYDFLPTKILLNDCQNEIRGQMLRTKTRR